MIRCSHCGKLAPAGAMSCQNCGMPLVTNSAGMASAGQGEQQELPAWLESLRAHERPVASGLGNQQPFSMDELVDENAMPRWMSQEHSRMAESGSSDAFPALAATPQPGSDPERQAFPASGLEAGSLIDEQSLPSWMRGAQDGGQPGAGQNFSANSLVDQQALPPWIKELGQTAPAQSAQQQYGLPQPPPITPPSAPRMPKTPQPPVRNESSAPLVQGFSAHDLLDQRALPGWMTSEEQGAGSQPQSRPVPTGSGFTAGDLIDQRSVPKWMQDQQGQAKSDPISALGVPVNGSGQMTGLGQGIEGGEGMPASTLLDMNSMPAWMREGEQGAQQSGPGMAAGSLIDVGGLPAWMRNSENTPPNAGMPAQNIGQARSEGIRVPSRPRTDAGTQEQSEAAANIFASMLGVAASAPVMPGQSQTPLNNLGVAQGQPGQYPQPQVSQASIPGWQSPQPQAAQSAQPQGWQMAGASPIPNAYTPGGQAGSMPPRASMPGQASYPGLAGTNTPGTGAALGVGSNNNGQAQATDAKKKGFFDAIREFFFK